MKTTMDLPVNRFKEAIQAKQRQIGLWCSLTGTVGLEICAGAEFDWMLIDCEHTPNDIGSLLLALQTVAGYHVQPVVRPPTGDPVTIKRYLDIGVQSLLIPMVETAEQAAALVAAVRYPPHGVRGVSGQTRAGRWGRIPGYLGRASEEICLIIQIESAIGIENAAEIASVSGIDGVFFGPADLAASMGYLGQPGHPDVVSQVTKASAEVMAAGKPVGTLNADEELSRHYLSLGFTFVAVGIDTALLAAATSNLQNRFMSA